MVRMAKAPKPQAETGDKRKRNTIFISLDDATELRLQKFLETHRVKPDRAAVGLAALLEFLDRVEAEAKQK